jgi:ribosomal protein S6
MDSKSVVVKKYELTYLLPGSLTDKEVQGLKDEINKLIAKQKVTVEKTDEWGRKQMAYVMSHEGKKQHDAFYVHMVLSMPSSQAQAFEQSIFLFTKIMRHLFIVADEKSTGTEVNS